ncbi:hypothetical protein GLGCALEP_03645 [Pseudomonas sp. MM221]|nr:hypothetical protein GLGCALEP_03645 [Pseudomonas sp. MM221]
MCAAFEQLHQAQVGQALAVVADYNRSNVQRGQKVPLHSTVLGQ